MCRPSKNANFLHVAEVLAERSDCRRAQVGAVLVDARGKIKGTGYNASPAQVPGCNERVACYRIANNIESGTRYETCRSVHAEQNAIIQAGEEKCAGGTLYVYGHLKICILCKRFIINAGIKSVILATEDNYREYDPLEWVNDL